MMDVNDNDKEENSEFEVGTHMSISAWSKSIDITMDVARGSSS